MIENKLEEKVERKEIEERYEYTNFFDLATASHIPFLELCELSYSPRYVSILNK